MKNLNCAVIGVGSMGANHARVYSELANLVAVVDHDKKLAKKTAQQYDATPYTDHKKMLAQEELDAVAVVVPTKHHYQVASNVLKEGIPTLVEKPITSTVKQGRQLQQLAKEHDTSLMVGHIERFNPAVQKLKELIDSDQVGKILQLTATRVGVQPPQTTNSDVVLDLAIHDIDVCNYLLDTTPSSSNIHRGKVYSNQKTDVADIELTYKNKARTIISSNWITPIKIRKLTVTGIKGYIELDYIKQSISLYQKQNPPKQIANYYQFVQFSEPVTKKIKVEKQEPLANEISYFLKHRNNRKKLDEVVESAINAIEIVLL